MDAAQQVLCNPELTAHIFSSLNTGGKTNWKGDAARLAVVNQAFHSASASVLWENMDSFQPFSALFPMVWAGDKSPVRRSYLAEEEERFNFYSKNTRRLTLDASEPFCSAVDESLIPHLREREGRIEDPLFPGLVGMTLRSTDPLPLFMAAAVGPRVKSLSIEVSSSDEEKRRQDRDSIWKLITGIRAQKTAPRGVQLLLPRIEDPSVIQEIAKIKSVRMISVDIDEEKLTGLPRTLWDVPQVMIGRYPVVLPREPTGFFHDQIQDGQAANVRSLVVSGTVEMHALVCWHINEAHKSGSRPQGYKRITLAAVQSRNLLPVPLPPGFIAKHMSLNPEVTSLMVEDRTIKNFPPTPIIEAALTIVKARWIEPLLLQISASRHLTSLRFIGLRLRSDGILGILEAIHALAGLKEFILVPEPVTWSEADALVFPQATCLGEIALKCPSLVSSILPVDTHSVDFDIPEMDPGVVPSFLHILYIYPPPKGKPEHTDEERTHLSDYLKRVFPRMEKWDYTSRTS